MSGTSDLADSWPSEGPVEVLALADAPVALELED